MFCPSSTCKTQFQILTGTQVQHLQYRSQQRILINFEQKLPQHLHLLEPSPVYKLIDLALPRSVKSIHYLSSIIQFSRCNLISWYNYHLTTCPKASAHSQFRWAGWLPKAQHRGSLSWISSCTFGSLGCLHRNHAAASHSHWCDSLFEAPQSPPEKVNEDLIIRVRA